MTKEAFMRHVLQHRRVFVLSVAALASVFMTTGTVGAQYKPYPTPPSVQQPKQSYYVQQNQYQQQVQQYNVQQNYKQQQDLQKYQQDNYKQQQDLYKYQQNNYKQQQDQYKYQQDKYKQQDLYKPQQSTYQPPLTNFPGNPGPAPVPQPGVGPVTPPAPTQGNVTNGMLLKGGPTNPYKPGCYEKLHSVYLAAGVTYIIDMKSNQFDSYLCVEHPGTGTVLAKDDDGGGFPHARIVFTPPASGTYNIVATTCYPGETGMYQVTITQK
jgi:hypothetical protein